MLNEIKSKQLVIESVKALRRSIKNSHVYFPSNISKFVFLCGANKNPGEISERRKALINFAKKNLPHTHFFLAEKMFSILKEENHKGNILDVENQISDFSDYILIVLESPSSFAELGAFAHDSLRSKLIVINNIEFEKSESFINLGPIKAVEEKSGKSRIIHYKMNIDGINRLDAIGETFHKIYELLKDPIKSTNTAATLDSLNPAISFNKNSAMFLHDLIYLSGPILHKEIIELLKLIFGNDSYNKTAHLLAILCSFEYLARDKKGLYRSKTKSPYFKFKNDTSQYISTFRNYMSKKYPERLYGYKETDSR